MYKIESLSAAGWGRLVPLLSSYPYKPYAAYRREFGEPALTHFFLDTTRKRLEASGTHALLASSGGKAAGFALWSLASLESQVFGFRTARLEYLIAEGEYGAQREIYRALLADLLGQCATEGIQHISLRVAAVESAAIHALEEAGFLLVDGLITYGRILGPDPLPAPSPDFQVRPMVAEDLPEIMDLARSAYSFDRLHVDPAVPKAAADEIHGRWLANSCASGATDRVLVAVDAEGPLGYSVFRINQATVPHLGEPLGVWVIASAHARSRGMGVAKSMCLVMLDWYKTQGIRIVEGGTQLANVASARLHESCNFRVVSTSVSLSKWIGGSR
jgi:RimJ/RimL family protein N-acetyltransferase